MGNAKINEERGCCQVKHTLISDSNRMYEKT